MPRYYVYYIVIYFNIMFIERRSRSRRVCGAMCYSQKKFNMLFLLFYHYFHGPKHFFLFFCGPTDFIVILPVSTNIPCKCLSSRYFVFFFFFQKFTTNHHCASTPSSRHIIGFPNTTIFFSPEQAYARMSNDHMNTPHSVVSVVLAVHHVLETVINGLTYRRPTSVYRCNYHQLYFI